MMKKLTGLLILAIGIYACGSGTKENEVEEYFSSIKNDKEKLRVFFKGMPKGGDIHHHVNGSIYAESYIKTALKDSCYINPNTYQLYFGLNDALNQKDNAAILINAFLDSNPNEKDSIINHWSIRDYKKYNRDGHDWFFSTFQKFEPAFLGHESELLSELCQKAKEDNIQYIETMISVPNIMDSVAQTADTTKWNNDKEPLKLKLSKWYEIYEENGIDKWARANADSLNSYIAKTNTDGIKLKFQTYGVRIYSDQAKIFGQLILAFKTAELTDNLVGVNFVAPEDNKKALENYTTHMKMFQFLNEKHPTVNISLHSGELALGKGDAKKDDLKFHIFESLNIASATRIGHGIDLLSETNKGDILKIMKEKGFAVEINLESNEVILQTNAETHPVTEYLKHGVPICISTDDGGVLRTNLTNQYVLLMEYLPETTYHQIKGLVMNSIKYSFLKPSDKKTLSEDLTERFELFEKNLTINNKKSLKSYIQQGF